MLRTRTPHKHFTALVVAIVILAWLELSIWSLSPYAKYLNHEILAHFPFSFSGSYLALLLIFVFGWLLMTVAMMLPTSLPLVILFRRLTYKRPKHLQLVLLLVAGYLAVWTFFGGLAHFGDLFIHEAVHRWAWLEANAWVLGAATLLLAGLYQFSSLKYACLDKCRSPLSFITEHWQGRGEGRQSFWLGLRHGLFCLGCCWHLMLLMFAFACGNVAWMLGLGAVMAAEKNMAWGRRMSTPLGIVLLLSGLGVATTSLLMA